CARIDYDGVAYW
nr:immunoglobulin heavy chain junction region [Mus musculus]